MAVVLTVIAWVVWVVLIVLGSVLALFVLAFGGDEPRANVALRKALPIALLAIALALVASFSLLAAGGWWRLVLSYLLALAPPVLMLGVTTIVLRHVKRSAPGPDSDRSSQ